MNLENPNSSNKTLSSHLSQAYAFTDTNLENKVKLQKTKQIQDHILLSLARRKTVAEVTAGTNKSLGMDVGATRFLIKTAKAGTPKMKSRNSFTPPTPVNPAPIKTS